MKVRKEKDALGEVPVPADKYYGAQTQRALQNFKIGDEKFPFEFIKAHALVKKAAARVNCELGSLDKKLSSAIEQAADEVMTGKWSDHFPLVIWQSGSATQFNMNVNEVIANRGIDILGGKIGTKTPIHPNDHVNMSQSTNDTIPTSIHIASVLGIQEQLLPALNKLQKALLDRSTAFKDIIKIGRTHLQDATPLTLGQEFSGYSAQLEICQNLLQQTLSPLYDLPIGGTAVGTGINSKKGYDQKMVAEIKKLTGFPFKVAANKFAGLASHEAAVQASGTLKTLAAALIKIANDIRWLGSGPRCGLGEIQLPANEPGSSIMPGKINPTQSEMVSMIACQIFGNDTIIAMAGAMGNFELNVFKPIIAHALLKSIRLLADACHSFTDHCIIQITANREKIQEHVNNSLMLVTALNQHIGYDKASQISLKAWRENKTLKQAAIELNFVSEQQFQEWVRPELMLGPDDE